ncbi:uncharacterized protein LOC142319870 [Lycorma delicatula]|uniref:uncharacterized protein LOC142319870 n=1 Tax=Lycorma delicatula TaxID=130591 RepID=UPI003F513C40
MTLSITDSRETWRCAKYLCRQVQLRSKTWLDHSKLGYDKILMFIYCWSHKLTSQDFCEHELGINHNTVVDWNNYLQEVYAAKLLAKPLVIGGFDLTIETDESVFAKRKYNVGRVPKQQRVYGEICRETKQCFLYAVENRSLASLMPIIIEITEHGSLIMSDQWKSSNGIGSANKEYDHQTVNRSQNFIDQVTGVHTNTVERMWDVAKPRFRRRFRNHSQMLDSYLYEFMWRKRFPAGANPFETILQDIAGYWPPK